MALSNLVLPLWSTSWFSLIKLLKREISFVSCTTKCLLIRCFTYSLPSLVFCVFFLKMPRKHYSSLKTPIQTIFCQTFLNLNQEELISPSSIYSTSHLSFYASCDIIIIYVILLIQYIIFKDRQIPYFIHFILNTLHIQKFSPVT